MLLSFCPALGAARAPEACGEFWPQALYGTQEWTSLLFVYHVPTAMVGRLAALRAVTRPTTRRMYLNEDPRGAVKEVKALGRSRSAQRHEFGARSHGMLGYHVTGLCMPGLPW